MTDLRARLEAAIDRDPDDPRGYAVLADHLQERGDPRGELIALQLAAESDPVLQPAADAYLAAHHARFAGAYAGVEVRWSRGFARTLIPRSEAPEVGDALAHLSSRFVRSIHLVDDRGPARSWIEALAATSRPTLTCLELGDAFLAPIGDVAAVWPAVPNLKTLWLSGQDARLGAIALPRLECFGMSAYSIAPDTIDEVARAQWPELAELELNPGSSPRELWHALIAMLAHTALPKLERLALRRCAILEELVPQLAALPILRQLRTLELTSGTLTDAGAEVLAHHAEAFAHLERFVPPGPPDDDDPRIDGVYDY